MTPAAKSDAQYAIRSGRLHLRIQLEPSGLWQCRCGDAWPSHGPASEIVSLEDYRTRYATYRGDASLQALHAKMPLIAIWDDHEFANNAYVTGAENHNPATQGDWAVRKANASRAYHESMPIRTDASGNLLKIYRRFDFGSLMTLHMLDTRIEGRTRQYDNYGDADGGCALPDRPGNRNRCEPTHHQHGTADVAHRRYEGLHGHLANPG